MPLSAYVMRVFCPVRLLSDQIVSDLNELYLSPVFFWKYVIKQYICWGYKGVKCQHGIVFLQF